ncbi:MAG: ACP S-malonyltransferase [Burkholderiales bacterium]|nr:ACP S-malonyltransferase [Burkholderiales bacterium]MDR4516870.1 ACP S-malonyltransferase [Nitrosomonas sp.]
MICYMFPGQGSQTKGMGEGLFDEFPEITKMADDILGYSIKKLCLENENLQLNNTQYTQPAIYVVNTLTYLKKLKQTKKKPDYVAGHSLGEYNALQVAGAFSFEAGLTLVKCRGELMAQAGEGAMAAILKMSKAQIRQCLDENGLSSIDIANYNGPAQIVISGLPADINRAKIFIENAGSVFIPLNTSGAFHSRYMEPIKAQFESFLEQFEFAELNIPVISNIDAQPYKNESIKTYLASQITHSVMWEQSMLYLLELGIDEFEEIGNGQVLSKLIASIKLQYSSTKKYSIKQTAQQSENIVDMPKNQIDNWNNHYPIGTPVKAKGYKKELQTRSNAMFILNNKAVIYLLGYKGYFPLNEISVIPSGK